VTSGGPRGAGGRGRRPPAGTSRLPARLDSRISETTSRNLAPPASLDSCISETTSLNLAPPWWSGFAYLRNHESEPCCGLLVWIPDRNLVGVFVAVSALSGACHGFWTTQCAGMPQIRPLRRLLGWRRGVVLIGVRRMNELYARRARSVPGWVTVFGRVCHLGM